MIENADAMVLGMGEPDRDDDVLAEALWFTGVPRRTRHCGNCSAGRPGSERSGRGWKRSGGLPGGLFPGRAGRWPKPVSKRGLDGWPRFWASDCSDIN